MAVSCSGVVVDSLSASPYAGLVRPGCPAVGAIWRRVASDVRSREERPCVDCVLETDGGGEYRGGFLRRLLGR